jgi:hypothetical protein
MLSHSGAPHCSNFFLWRIFAFLRKIFSENKILSEFPYFIRKNSKNLTKIVMIAYNMQGCLRFYTFMFLISPDLAKLTYGLLPLEQHHKIEKKKKKKKKSLCCFFFKDKFFYG